MAVNLSDVNKKKNFRTAESRKATGNDSSKPTTASKKDFVKGNSKGKAQGESREKILKEKFHPESIAYLKENFGLDLASETIPVSVLKDIAGQRMTPPLEIVVKPVVYDKSSKSNVEVMPLKAIVSMIIRLPYEKSKAGFKPIAPSKEHPVFVATYPCHEYLEKTEPTAVVVEGDETKKVSKEDLKFSDKQIIALESIGIREERLYFNSVKPLSIDTKRAILGGQAFDADGCVRINDGVNKLPVTINVNGRAVMKTAKDGSVSVNYSPVYPSEPKANEILDIDSIRKIGNLELFLYDTYKSLDGKSHVKTDAYNHPILSQAGKDLIRYGIAFDAVTGKIATKSFNNKTCQYDEKVEYKKYQVSVVNGGLCATDMKKVMELDENGKETQQYHYESRNNCVFGDKVLVNGDRYEAASPRDLENIKRGLGGVVKDYETKDNETGKTVIYDAFVVPDNRKGGFAKVFSEKVSKELAERFAEKKKLGKKQNFSIGF